jgi:hypothetical protein
MARYSIVIALLALFAGSLATGATAHADMATPMASDLPELPAPFGLGSITLPRDEQAIAALFRQLPERVDRQPRDQSVTEQGDRRIAAYGAPDPLFGPLLFLQAINFKEGDFFPKDFTAGTFVAATAENTDYGTGAFGRDGNLVWVQAETTAGVAGEKPGTPTTVRPIYTLAWGEADSPWLFGAAAFTPEGLEAFVRAFVTAATAPPATPSLDATPDVAGTPSARRVG